MLFYFLFCKAEEPIGSEPSISILIDGETEQEINVAAPDQNFKVPQRECHQKPFL